MLRCKPSADGSIACSKGDFEFSLRLAPFCLRSFESGFAAGCPPETTHAAIVARSDRQRPAALQWANRAAQGGAVYDHRFSLTY